jgi:hypothetical protein
MTRKYLEDTKALIGRTYTTIPRTSKRIKGQTMISKTLVK